MLQTECWRKILQRSGIISFLPLVGRPINNKEISTFAAIARVTFSIWAYPISYCESQLGLWHAILAYDETGVSCYLMMTQPAAAGGNDDAQEEETDTSTGKDWESVTLWVLKTRSNGNGNVMILVWISFIQIQQKEEWTDTC